MDNYLFWVLTAAYAAHVMEEYSLDWKGWVQSMTGLEVPWADFFVTNAAVIVLGICCAMIGWDHPALSLGYPALMLINAVFFHVLPTIVKRAYSPGVLTSLALFIPLPAYCFYTALRTRGVGMTDIALAMLGGALVMAYPLLIQRLRIAMERCGGEDERA
jgi:hypothetical protein